MTKFEIMLEILFGCHLFFEMLTVGALVKIEEAIRGGKQNDKQM